jgi:hypothetical protein
MRALLHTLWSAEKRTLMTTTVALSLLLSAATASADGAWVLWQEFQSASPSMLMVNWEIVTTTESESACAGALATNLRNRQLAWQTNGAKDIEVGGDTIRSSWQSAAISVRFVCLPDTNDPRAPKTR